MHVESSVGCLCTLCLWEKKLFLFVSETCLSWSFNVWEKQIQRFARKYVMRVAWLMVKTCSRVRMVMYWITEFKTIFIVFVFSIFKVTWNQLTVPHGVNGIYEPAKQAHFSAFVTEMHLPWILEFPELGCKVFIKRRNLFILWRAMLHCTTADVGGDTPLRGLTEFHPLTRLSYPA